MQNIQDLITNPESLAKDLENTFKTSPVSTIATITFCISELSWLSIFASGVIIFSQYSRDFVGGLRTLIGVLTFTAFITPILILVFWGLPKYFMIYTTSIIPLNVLSKARRYGSWHGYRKDDETEI